LIDREFRVLFRKEWRQLVASKAALATGSLLPIFMLGIVPMFLSAAARTGGGRPHGTPEAMNVGLFLEMGQDARLLPGAMLPMMVALVGMIVPTMMATHLLITERERRTLELLVALPVRIEQVLVAKLLATLLAASLMTVPMLVFDMIALPLAGHATLEQMIALPILLAAALALSTSIALLMSLLSPDFRAANNIAGALLAPVIIFTMAGGMILPGGAVRPLGIAVAYAIAAVLVMRYSLRTVTYERLLS
jgi:ABC-type transport system involved in multi-copper enzyme maturation permease subunit